jgi:arginine N-succinyltransferase
VLILRPIAKEDLPDLLALAAQLDSVNLPSDRKFLESRIEHSRRSFASASKTPVTPDGDVGVYVFVLEDRDAGRIIGSSLVISKQGVPGTPYYWLEVSSEERFSAGLGKRFIHSKLRLRSTEDGPSEIGGLILDPAYRGHPDKCGKALSIVRFAYMGIHPERFEREVIAEMLSPFNEHGRNLLWDAFGWHFTGLEYREADRLSARDKRFIADLFPQDPVYATLFPNNVQEVIGKPNDSARAAVRILEKVGFRYLNQVDPFDGGPYYGASRDAITSVRERRELVLPGESRVGESESDGPLSLISSETALGFRATVVRLEEDGAPWVTKAGREALGVKGGDRVTVTPLP